jgi:cell division protein ZapA (FtsZ GTPase activity inhibitor)
MRTLLLSGLMLVLFACPGPAPTPTDGGVDGGVSSGTFCEPPPVYAENLTSCQPLATDYLPRVSNSSTDSWPACISDSNTFTPIDPNISSIARVTAFENIATLLWRDGVLPGPQSFVDARVAYALDQGIDSRVQRREDMHYPAAPSPCSTAGIPAQYPDRCAGPMKLLPILNDAFARGAMGERPRVHAARIEAALVWFFYLSPLSEVISCTTKPQDCDSSWAYYAGGTQRDTPQGLGKIFRSLGRETHDRSYDATLAVRCWRNLDNETGVATDTARRDLAFAQLDVALLRGVALLVRQRATELACTTGEIREARLAFLATLGPLLDRAARERNVASADVLAREVGRASAAEVDVAALTGALDALFPCP